jgi:predicted transcriptional regulator
MKKEKIKQQIDFNEVDNHVYINNSIFNELLNCQELNHISRRAYAYGYYCLITYLYKNAKYQKYLLKQSDLKKILGYNPEHRGLDIISKKDGLLDRMGYTETITDFPIRIDTGRMIVFDMYRNTKNKISFGEVISNNYKVKLPVKAFYKDKKSKEAGILNGSYYNADDCHVFDVESFLECVGNEAIGCVGFFIASYIKALEISLRTGPFSNMIKVANAFGLTKKTFYKYINALVEAGLIDVDFRHNQDVREVSLYLRHQLNDWRKACLTKYNNSCFISGAEVNLHVHHVYEPFGLIRDRIFDQGGIEYKPFNEYPREELDFLSYRIIQAHYDVEGIPLREDLHILLHQLYGNSPSIKDLTEFINQFK